MWVTRALSGPLLHVDWLSIRTRSLHQGVSLLGTVSFGSNSLCIKRSLLCKSEQDSPRCPELKAPEMLAVAGRFWGSATAGDGGRGLLWVSR